MIIGLTGTNAAGKSTVAKYIAGKGFKHYSISGELKEILNSRGGEVNRDNLIAVGNEMRKKFGAGYLAWRILRKINGNAVVESIRNIQEVDVLRGTDMFYLIAVDASVEVRFNRSREIGRKGEGETLEEFMKKEKREMKGARHEEQIESCILEADYNIANNSNIAALHWNVDLVMKKISDAEAKKREKTEEIEA